MRCTPTVFNRIPAPPRSPLFLMPLCRTIFDNDTVSAFSNSAIFVVAIMLSGVLEDYKEAESMVRAGSAAERRRRHCARAAVIAAGTHFRRAPSSPAARAHCRRV
jgi:hypothetical protein